MKRVIFFLYFFALATSTRIVAPHKGPKPRSASYQETSKKKASTYVNHTKALSASLHKSLPKTQSQLDEALNTVNDWFSENHSLGSIIGSETFPQSLINCINDFTDESFTGDFDNFELLEELLLPELQRTEDLNLHEKMDIFSTINYLLTIFFAAVLATAPERADFLTAIKTVFEKVFATQEVILTTPRRTIPLTRAHSV